MIYPPAKKLSPPRISTLCALALLAATVSCQAKPKAGDVISSEETKFKLEMVADGLKNPWALVKLPDGRLLVTERPGQLRIIADGKLLDEPVANVPEVWARGQGGLMDLELHPDYAQNGWLYISYSDPLEKKAHTRIIRAKLKDNALTEIETVFQAPEDQYTGGGVHFGNRMEFDAENYLYFTIGERGDRDKAQSLKHVQGKTHRIHDDGRIPQDNPFVKEDGAMPSIWSWGNRNQQGLRFQPGTGLLWSVEHGPKGGDELNIIRRGLNYGWPVITYGINYNGQIISDKTEAPGMEQPVVHWTPSIAVGSIDFYEGDKFPAWKGNMFVTALAHQKIVRVVIAGEKVTHQEILVEGSGRIRDVRCLDDGFIYLVYDSPGQILRIVPAS